MIKNLKTLRVPAEYIEAKRHTKNPDMYGLMRGFLTPESKDNPSDVARRFLAVNDIELGAVFSLGALSSEAGPGQLVVSREARSPDGYHVRFEQKHEGVSIIGAGASVHMTEKRQIHYATNDMVSEVPPIDVAEETATGISMAEAIRTAVQHVDGQHRLQSKPQAELAIWHSDDQHYLVWKTNVSLQGIKPLSVPENRAAAWQVLVDVASGEVLSSIDVLSRATGKGKVFYPNPVVTLRTTNLQVGTQFAEYTYRRVDLPRLRRSGYLSGKYVTTRLTPRPRAFSRALEFLFGSHDPRFEEVMVYYWIDRVCAYLHTLGFRQFAKRPIPVNARGTEDDQSWYDPNTKELNFGLGGVNDAEDADIILHELGHAFLDGMVPEWGRTRYDAPVRAMGEGVGDFLACCYLADVNGNYHPQVVGDWDAFAYPHTTPPALRRVDGVKTLHNVVGRGAITSLGTESLTDDSAEWVPGALTGLLVTPNVDARPRPTYMSVADNTATEIILNMPFGKRLTDLAQVGDLYAGEEHQDGEFWSAVLWDIYLALGGDSGSAAGRREASEKALRLVLTAHIYLDDADRETIGYRDAAEALLEADRFVWGVPMASGPNEALLLDILHKRELL